MKRVTKATIQKLLGIIDQGLVAGLGEREPGKFCVEAAVCYALDLPHGDDPGCVSSAVRALKIQLNDSRWSSNAARAKGLRRLAVIQLGTKGRIDDGKFAARAARAATQTVVPQVLRRAAKRNPKYEQALLDAALLCEKEPTRENALKAKAIALDASAADVASRYAAACAYYAAAAADAASRYADACAASAGFASASCASYYASYDAGFADQLLSDFAEAIVQELIEMKAPGAKWLPLTETT